MNFRHFVIALAAVTAGCSTPPKQEPARKPGFLERAWTSAQKGSRSVLDATKSGVGKGWETTKDLAAAPFSKKKSKPATSKFRELATGIQIKPDVVRLPSTRSIEATVSVTNNAERALQLSFPTSQHIEVLVKTEDGKVVHRWSDDQRIEREPNFLVVNPKERLEYAATISTRNMAVGKTYVIEASVPGYDAVFVRKVIVPQS